MGLGWGRPTTGTVPGLTKIITAVGATGAILTGIVITIINVGNPTFDTTASVNFAKTQVAATENGTPGTGGGGGGGGTLTPTMFIATTGTDSGTCHSAGSPCKTFSYAYGQAAAGDVISVASGTYAAQTLSGTSKTGTPVIFTGAGRTSTTLGTMTIQGPAGNVTLQHMGSSSLVMCPQTCGSAPGSSPVPHNIELDDYHVNYLQGKGVDTFTMVGGDVGRNFGNDTAQFFIDVAGGPVPRNLTFDGVAFHDAVRRCADDNPPRVNGSGCTDSTVHVDCLQIYSVTGTLIVRNSTFYNCGTQGLFLQDPDGAGGKGANPSFNNVIVENNAFGGVPDSFYNANLGDVAATKTGNTTFGGNVTVRYNGFQNSCLCNGHSGNWLIEGNLGPAPKIDNGSAGPQVCGTGGGHTSYSHNVFNQACGATDFPSSNYQFVNAGPNNTSGGGALNEDMHILSGSAGIDRGNALDFPSSDFDGNPRPFGAGPDAGPDEFGSTGGTTGGGGTGGTSGIPAGQFPVRTAGSSWQTVDFNDWTSGFFPGSEWLLDELTGDTSWATKAAARQTTLAQRDTDNSTHDIGFVIMSSYGNAFRATGDASYMSVIQQAAATLATRYNSTVGAFRSWDAVNDTTQFRVIVDSLMTDELMFYAAAHGGQSTWRTEALQHALTVARDFVRPDGSTFHLVNYNQTTGAITFQGTNQGFSNTSTWSRGQAWAIYGFTMAYRYTQDARMLADAEKVADWWLANIPADHVPYWDFNAPLPTSRDSSAAAIAASGLLELAHLETNPTKATAYKTEADNALTSLSSSSYSAQGTTTPSLLLHGTQNHNSGVGVDVGLIFGDYFFLEALQREQGVFRTP